MKKLLAATLASALTLGAVSPVLAANQPKGSRFANEFRDWDEDYWANESLARMISRGVMKGNGDGTIASDRPVTRLEAAIMLARVLDLKIQPVTEGTQFESQAWKGTVKVEKGKDHVAIKWNGQELEDDDQLPAWGRDAMMEGLKRGFILFDGARLQPMAPLTRLQAAIMLVRAAGLEEQAKAMANAPLPFTDANQIPNKYAERGYVAVAVEKGFVKGFEDGSFAPHAKLTRAQWAALVDRMDRAAEKPVAADGRQVMGTISSVTTGDAPSITVKTPAYPEGKTYAVDDTAVFYRDGKAITIADLQPGQQVIINLTDLAVNPPLILMVTEMLTNQFGQVTAYTAPTADAGGSITLKVANREKTLTVAANASVMLGKNAATLAEIQVGDMVNLLVSGDLVERIDIKVDCVEVEGELTEVTPATDEAQATVTITPEDGEAVTFNVSETATIEDEEGEPLTLEDLKSGDELEVKVERNVVVEIVRDGDND